MDKIQPRMKTHYQTYVRAKLQEEFAFSNPHQIPTLDKIVLKEQRSSMPTMHISSPHELHVFLNCAQAACTCVQIVLVPEGLLVATG